MSDAATRLLFKRHRNAGSQNLSWPAMGIVGAGPTAGVTLTGGNVQWAAAPYTAVVAANAIATEFWFTGMHWYTANGVTLVNMVEWYNLTLTTIIAQWLMDITAASPNSGSMFVPIPLYMAANTAISARAGGAGNGKTIIVRMHYMVGI